MNIPVFISDCCFSFLLDLLLITVLLPAVNTIPKRGRKRPIPDGGDQSSPISQPSDDLIHTLTSAHHATFSPACHAQQLTEASLWAAEADVGVEGRTRAQQFAMMVPGIASLPPVDQQTVLNQAVPEVMVRFRKPRASCLKCYRPLLIFGGCKPEKWPNTTFLSSRSLGWLPDSSPSTRDSRFPEDF